MEQTLQKLLKTFSVVEKVVEKIGPLLQNFKKGYKSGNSPKLKNRAIIIGIIVSIISLVVAGLTIWGMVIPLNESTILIIGSLIVSAIEIGHSIVHTVTSDTVGVNEKNNTNENNDNGSP